jgi:hypothetical protein
MTCNKEPNDHSATFGWGKSVLLYKPFKESGESEESGERIF